MIVLIDNYDSFTYNLVQRLGEIDRTLEMRVFRNDKTSIEEIAALAPTHLIISPGPCTPAEAGISKDAIAAFTGKIPILGVCLGHQCMAEVAGGRVVRAGRIMHGKTSMIHHDEQGIYAGIENPFEATRYHSLIVEPGSLPEDYLVTAWTSEDEIMGIRHRALPIEGVQYHPESFLTQAGYRLLGNFLSWSC